MKISFRIFFVVFILFLPGCFSRDHSAKTLAQQTNILYAQAEKAYQKAILSAPGDPSLKIECADFYYSNRDYQKIKPLLAGIKDNTALMLLGKTLARLNDFTGALEIFEKVEKFSDPEALYLYGVTLEEKNLFGKALEVYKTVGSDPYQALARERIQGIKATLAQEELPSSLKKVITAAPASESVPDASAVVLFSDEFIQVSEENTMLSTVHAAVKIVKEKGKEEWGEIALEYDSTYERVELEFARTITPEGRVVYAGKENIRDVSKYLNFPLYSNVRVRIISMPEVSKNCVVEYRARFYRSSLVNGKDFSLIYNVQENYPVQKASLKLEVPETKPVSFKIIHPEYLPEHMTLEPKKSIQNGKLCFTWEMENIPQFLPEAEMVASSLVNPALVISTFTSWDEIFQWWNALISEKLTLTPMMKVKVKELIAGIENERDRARKIYEFCAQQIRYVAVEYGKGGYEPHTAEDVFLNKYGDCKDQAILLVALLKSVGIEAYPVLIPTEEAYNLVEDFPCLYFNHAIACVKIKDSFIFMDPTASTVSFGDLPLADQGRSVLICTKEKPLIVNTPVLSQNSLSIHTDIAMKHDETARVTRTIESSGFYSAIRRLYLQHTPITLVEEDLQEKMRTLSSVATMKEFKIRGEEALTESPFIRYVFDASALLSKVKGLRVLPLLSENVLDASYLSKDDRKYPVSLKGLYTMRISADVHLPGNLKVKYLPDFVDIVSPWVSLKIFYTHKESMVQFLQVMTIHRREVTRGEYPQFKNVVERILDSLKQQIILEKDENT